MTDGLGVRYSNPARRGPATAASTGLLPVTQAFSLAAESKYELLYRSGDG